MNLKLVS